ncbi:MAG: DUF5808 domain-containing protein, partial [Clostridiales Family XIII bacterium]|nr:DUF5808 domain-containing protein [Clostridiales Family XIII bacterium]
MMIFIWVFLDALVIVSFAFIPYITRKSELFGVGIPSSETKRPELNAMRRSFAATMVVLGLAVAAVQFLLLLHPSLNGGLSFSEVIQTSGIGAGLDGANMGDAGGIGRLLAAFLVPLFAWIALDFLVYLRYHGRMKRYKAAQGWGEASHVRREYGNASAASSVVLADTEPVEKEIFSALWLLLYVGIAAATLIIAYAVWPTAPERIAVHFGLTGEPDGWIDKTPGAMLPLFASQWILFGIFVFTYFIVRCSKRQLDASEPKASKEQGRRFRRIMSGSLIFGGAALGALLGYIPLASLIGISQRFISYFLIFFVCAIILAIVILYIRVGQGGSRLRAKGGGESAGAAPDEDRYWKLGVFYFNKNDPSLFVEKRFGVGYTNNWAHPQGWLLLIALIAA